MTHSASTPVWAIRQLWRRTRIEAHVQVLAYLLVSSFYNYQRDVFCTEYGIRKGKVKWRNTNAMRCGLEKKKT